MRIELTDEQLRSIAVCVVCGSSVDLDYARELLDKGESPGKFYCGSCRYHARRRDNRLHKLGSRVTTEMIVQQAKKVRSGRYPGG